MTDYSTPPFQIHDNCLMKCGSDGRVYISKKEVNWIEKIIYRKLPKTYSKHFFCNIIIDLSTLEKQEAAGLIIAKAIFPAEWQEYDDGGGVCSNGAGMDVLESVVMSKRILDALKSIDARVEAAL